MYRIISPKSFSPFPFTSVIVATLVTSNDGNALKFVWVGSSVVFPSLSSPSSEISDASLDLLGLFPVKETTFEIKPESKSDCVIKYFAV